MVKLNDWSLPMGRAVAVPPPHLSSSKFVLCCPHISTLLCLLCQSDKSSISTKEPLVLCTQTQSHTSPLSRSNRDCGRKGCFHTQRNGITKGVGLAHLPLHSSHGSCQKLKQGLTQKQSVSPDNPYIVEKTLWWARETILRTSQSAV